MADTLATGDPIDRPHGSLYIDRDGAEITVVKNYTVGLTCQDPSTPTVNNTDTVRIRDRSGGRTSVGIHQPAEFADAKDPKPISC